jgi:TP901 family phage tail tape measure protein
MRKVASLFAELTLDDTAYNQGMQNAQTQAQTFGSRMQGIASSMVGFGAAATIAFAPLTAGFGSAISQAVSFDTSMTNVQAVLGRTDEEMQNLNASILELGGDSIAGPDAVALAFYDVAGGVADATTHMSILEESIATAEAGNADLIVTTNALISAVNSYSFSAEDAAYASDVLTRTVGMGKGTMNEFAAAMPEVMGLADSLSISFGDLGAMTAFLTTNGNSASAATTQLGAMMTALLNPNEKMKDGLAELGFASGQVAIEQLGLVGAFEALQSTQTATENGMASMIGSIEGLRGVTSLSGAEFDNFSATFISGIEGATDAAQIIQREGVAAQWGLLNASLSELGITVGSVILPVLNNLMADIQPIIAGITDWMGQNPQLTQGLVALGAVLAVVGPVVGVLGAGLGAIGAVIGVVLSPVGLLIGGVAALGVAFATNFGGIRDAVMPVLESIGTFISTNVLPALGSLLNWFTVEGMPAIVSFVQGTVVPAIGGFITQVTDIWNVVSPALGSLLNWFTVEGMPAISNFITGTVMPAVQGFIDVLSGAWAILSPVVTDISEGIANVAMPLIKEGFDGVRLALDSFIGGVSSAWDAMSGPVTAIRDGINGALGPVIETINTLKAGFDSLAGISGAQQSAQAATAGMSNDAAWQATLAAAGGNDFVARIAFAGLRERGGDVYQGNSYLVGERGPELFVPSQTGAIVPNAQQMGGITISGITVYANNAQEGREAADAFNQQLRFQLAASGMG